MTDQSFTLHLAKSVPTACAADSGDRSNQSASDAWHLFYTIEDMQKKSAPAKKKSTSVKKTVNHVRKKSAKKWSSSITKNSNALDLEANVFESGDPHKIAVSLKRSAEKSTRRKGTPLQSSMSMLNFYINRAGKNLTAYEKKPLEEAKEELRKLFQK